MRVLYRTPARRRGGKCPYTFSFGNARSPMDEKADERLGRTCTQPPTPAAVRKEFSRGAELRAAGADPAGGELLGRRGGGVLRADGKGSRRARAAT